jgi:Mg/Co/Ni transporter MgtE (contains CBS domain)
MSASHAQQLSETRQRILHLLLSEHDLVDVLLDKSVDLNAAELRKITGWRQQLEHELPQLHAADLADILEALPEEERLALWRLVPYEQRGRVLVEASETVWASLTEEMTDREILRAIEPLDIDDQVYLARYLPRDLTGRLLTTLDPSLRARLLDVIELDRDRVGQVMDFQYPDRALRRDAGDGATLSAQAQKHAGRHR